MLVGHDKLAQHKTALPLVRGSTHCLRPLAQSRGKFQVLVLRDPNRLILPGIVERDRTVFSPTQRSVRNQRLSTTNTNGRHQQAQLRRQPERLPPPLLCCRRGSGSLVRISLLSCLLLLHLPARP